MEDTNWDVLVIGGGAAGLSAGLVLARARRRVLVVDNGTPRNRFAPHMHGVLTRDGYPPLQLLADGRREVMGYGGEILTGSVVSATAIDDGFEVALDSGSVHVASRLLVASGLVDELPDIDGLFEQWGKGVVQCPYCDGYELRDRRLGVIANLPTSLHHVQLVRQWSDDVTYFTHLTGAPQGDDLRGLEARGIHIDDRAIARIVSENDAIVGAEMADGSLVELDAVFVGPRLVARDRILEQLGAATEETPVGPWVATDAAGKTSVDGVWAAGNAANPAVLVPVASGMGVAAGVAINNDLVHADIARAVRQAHATT